jgi:hypothetical protein
VFILALFDCTVEGKEKDLRRRRYLHHRQMGGLLMHLDSHILLRSLTLQHERKQGEAGDSLSSMAILAM